MAGVTIRDVARRADCGLATVSRVLNGTGPVSPAMREAVEAAVRELDFHVNELGRALKRSRSGAIGCLVPSVANPVFADAIQGVQSRVAAAGYQLILATSDYDPGKEALAATTLVDARVEAVVLTVCDAAQSKSLEMLRRRGVPFCLMFNAAAESRPAVWFDNRAASYQAGKEFASLGHRHLAFVALRLSASDRSQARLQGLRDACSDHGLPEPVLIEVDESAVDLTDRLARILAEQPQITGIHASNDMLALATIRAAKGLGRSVPQDLALIGFDGIEIGTMTDPTLATIVTDTREMGRRAADAVLRALSVQGAVEPSDGAMDFTFRFGTSLAPEPRPPATTGALAGLALPRISRPNPTT